MENLFFEGESTVKFKFMRHTLPVAALILSGVPAPASTASAEETVRSDEVRVTATRVAKVFGANRG